MKNRIKMKYALVIMACLVCQPIWASKLITLTKTEFSKSPKCQLLNEISFIDNLTELEKSKKFSMPDEDFLTISLLNKAKQPCFTFKYTPKISPYLNLQLSNKEMTIKEIHGSTLSGNWLERKYKIDLKKQKLYLLSDFHTSFSADADGNIMKTVTRWQ